MRLLYVPVIAITLTISGCKSVSNSQDVTTPGKAKSGFMGLTTNADFKVSTPKAFASAENVIVSGFKVAFIESKRDTVKAGGGFVGAGFGGRSTALLLLNGVDNETKQAITDKAYADFVAELKTAGFNVLDRSNYTQQADYQKSKSYVSPYKAGSNMLSKYGETTYYQPSSFEPMRVYLGEVEGLTGGIGFSNPGNAASKYAKETGNKLLNVVYVVDFSNADTYGGKFTSSSAVFVGQGLSIKPEISKLSLIGGYGGTFNTTIGSIAVGQPIYSLEKFATVAEASSTTEKTVERVTNVIGILGGIGSNISTKFDVNADAGKYKNIVLDLTNKANDGIVAKMKSLK